MSIYTDPCYVYTRKKKTYNNITNNDDQCCAVSLTMYSCILYYLLLYPILCAFNIKCYVSCYDINDDIDIVCIIIICSCIVSISIVVCVVCVCILFSLCFK